MSDQENPSPTGTGNLRCPHCGGTELSRGVQMGLTAEVGHVGLSYKLKLIFGGTEPLLADLCLGCGTVVRLFVKQPRRNWIR